MEPERPMFVCLKKATELDYSTEDENLSKLYAYSSPSSAQITVKFELAEEVPSVVISFFSCTGHNLLNYRYGKLDAGECVLTLSPDIPEGYYTIKVVAGTKQLSTIIVK